jgi:tetratricopeptide (TPR) repeat protein
MRNDRFCLLVSSVILFAAFAAVTGCEGISRKHDPRVGDINPPPGDRDAMPGSERLANFPDLVEEMMATRQKYVHQLITLERSYLLAGDDAKANWARRQREATEAVEVFPYLTPGAVEQSVDVAPEASIPEADAIYNEAHGLLDQIRGIPMAGHLKANKEKARKALDLFKKVLREYPKSDKVDDCAFYCGEIYKEYLRDDDPEDELSVRYYQWAISLDPQTPHAARFQCAVVYDFRRHDRTKALELYHQVLDTDENQNESNARFSATRIEQLTDEDRSHLTPNEPLRPVPAEPVPSTTPPPARNQPPAAKTPARGATPAARPAPGTDMPPPLTRPSPGRTAPATRTRRRPIPTRNLQRQSSKLFL